MRFPNHPGLRLTPDECRDRARLAALTRHRGAGDPDVETARRDWVATRLADHIRHVIAEGPALTDQQRDELVELVRGRPTVGT